MGRLPDPTHPGVSMNWLDIVLFLPEALMFSPVAPYVRRAELSPP